MAYFDKILFFLLIFLLQRNLPITWISWKNYQIQQELPQNSFHFSSNFLIHSLNSDFNLSHFNEFLVIPVMITVGNFSLNTKRSLFQAMELSAWFLAEDNRFKVILVISKLSYKPYSTNLGVPKEMVPFQVSSHDCLSWMMIFSFLELRYVSAQNFLTEFKEAQYPPDRSVDITTS